LRKVGVPPQSGSTQLFAKVTSMNKALALSTILFGFSVLPAMAAAKHDVPWYLAHPQDRQAMVGACSDDPGDLAANPDCVNAGKAAQQVTLSGL
jgi:hypothetical protein